MDRYYAWSAHSSADDTEPGREDPWNWLADDRASERVTEKVRRWLEGMESAIATARPDRRSDS